MGGIPKPPSQTLPPHEGEGLGLGIKLVYNSDWYYLRLVRWYGWVGEGYLRAEIPACPACGVFESFWWGSVGLEEGLIKGVLRIVEGGEGFFPESLLIGMKFFLKGGIT